MNRMRLKLIACDVLIREVCLLIAKSPHIFDVEFTEKDSHNRSDTLRSLIQDEIDRSQGKKYDAILLGYGLCGNATVGLVARDTRIVVPRAHDCCTLFLGSKETFKQYFKDNPSQPFSSPGYMERSDSPFHDSLVMEDMESDPKYVEFVEKYGEANARYIYESMYGSKTNHSKLVYIEIPETANTAYAEMCRKRAEEARMEFVPLKGSLKLLKNLINGSWTEQDFLVLNPGQQSVGIYDWDTIIGGEDMKRLAE
ncbi:MAG: DUF1638 domain-containing protein [Deltaproteobacteria bacterium]|nr:DUF1638 domain-containing protein [Deltaproteobacteria bacterium]MBW2154662.1 DUF1638 domain-containing protein [Deltaproteobacteria bacterium]